MKLLIGMLVGIIFTSWAVHSNCNKRERVSLPFHGEIYCSVRS